MARLLPAALLLFLVGLGTYAGSFYATRSAFAATRCGAPNPPCTTYHAGQVGDEVQQGGYSNGIEGSIRYQDVAMYDNHDTLAHWLSSVTIVPNAWAQMGFFEGQDPYGNRYDNERLYTERTETAVCQGYRLQSWPAPYNPDYPMIYWTGKSFFCNPDGRTAYTYWVGRMGSYWLETVYLPNSLTWHQASSEEKIRIWMEPNGTQTYGDTIDLFLYNRTGGYWAQWDTSRPTRVVENEQASHYWHNPITNWTEFTTTSTGW